MGSVKVSIESLRKSPVKKEWVLVLKEDMVERYLPIYIGRSQADILGRLLMGEKISEPGDYSLSLTGVDREDFEPESVIINRFEDNTFYAKLLLKHGNELRDVECPPAEALVLSIRKGLPILVEAKVLDKAGIDVAIANNMGEKKH